jgi:hypothetical protein
MENNESKHPVLTALNGKIEELLAQLAKLQADYELLDSRYAREVRARQDRETYTQEAFVSAIQNGYDKETVVHLAYELDIDLTESKTYTVQAEFQVEVLVEIGEDFDFDELDFDLTHEHLQDYTFTGIISSEEN